ncbi:MAG: helix-turn-helix transcriptional regulator [Sphingobium sp.]
MPEQDEIVGVRHGAAPPSFWNEDKSIRRLLSAIGRPAFYGEMLDCLGDICGAEHVHVFLLEGAKPQVLSELSRDGSAIAVRQSQVYLRDNLWLHDDDMLQGSRVEVEGPRLFQFDSERSGPSEIGNFYRRQDLRERLMLFGRGPFGTVGLSMLRPTERGVLGPEDGRRLGCASELVFPMIIKHLEAINQSQRMIQALTSLAIIEHLIALAPEKLPRREQQVAARLLYGLSASSIAVDLGIGQQTAQTHRKRLYERLAISCHRELLIWYLDLYSRVGGDIVDRLRSPD